MIDPARSSGDRDRLAPRAIEAGGLGPPPVDRKVAVVSASIAARIVELAAQPLRDRNAYRVADQRPSQRQPPDALGRLRPIRLETLEPFRITNVWRDHSAVGQEDGRWRRDSYCGAVLECRDRVDGPSQASGPFSPIETVGTSVQSRVRSRSDDIFRQEECLRDRYQVRQR